MTVVLTPQHCNEMWKQIKSHPIYQHIHSVYAEVVRKNLAKPHISICVKDPSDDCRVGFRGTKPWRITGYHVAGVGDPVVIRCGNIELWIKRYKYGISGIRNSTVVPYGGPTDIAVRIWWRRCLKIWTNNRPYITYYICP